jgi:hypothetical protein
MHKYVIDYDSKFLRAEEADPWNCFPDDFNTLKLHDLRALVKVCYTCKGNVW